MKRHLPLVLLVLFFIAPAAVHALTDGDSATDLLGQYNGSSLTDPVVSYTKGASDDAVNRLGFSSPRGNAIDTVHHRFFLADTANNRVLVYTLDSNNDFVDRIPDYVLGQSGFGISSPGTTAAKMRSPYALVYDSANDRLFVAESTNHRVTVFDTASISDGENAVYVLGQSAFTSSGTAVTQTGMNTPRGLAYDPTTQHLFVVDGSNNRVLVFSGSSLSTGMSAAKVLGQTTFTSSAASVTQARMSGPQSAVYDASGAHLFVAEGTNNRVVVFSGASLTDGMNATHILGKTSYTSATAATTTGGLSLPQGLAWDNTGKRLFVAESTNNRVVVYDLNAITNGENATGVLGQTVFSVATSGTTQSKLKAPHALTYDATNQRLYVSDTSNHRVMAFDVATVSNGENAINALGQYDDSLTDPSPIYTRGTAHNAPNKLGLSGPEGGVIDAEHLHLFVSDQYNHRILVYNLNCDLSLEDRVPDYVLGQSNFYTNTAGTSQSGLQYPEGLAYDPSTDLLYVAEYGNNRVSVFDVASISDGENAVAVLGQSSFTGSTAHVTQGGMNGPYGLALDTDNQRLFVGNIDGNRITVYDVASITNGENATAVLGQSTFTGSTAARTQAGVSLPYGIGYDPTRQLLFVVNADYERVMVYDVNAITNGENAVYVLGQTSFTGSVTGTTQSRFSSTLRGLTYDDGSQQLFVSDAGNNRILVFDTSTISNGMNASHVLGQSLFTTSAAATTQNGLYLPTALVYDENREKLWAFEFGNNRLMLFDIGTNSYVCSSSSSSSTSSSSSSSSVNSSSSSQQVQRTGGARQSTLQRREQVTMSLENSSPSRQSSSAISSGISKGMTPAEVLKRVNAMLARRVSLPKNMHILERLRTRLVRLFTPR